MKYISRQLGPFFYYITIKLGRIFGIRPLSRPLNFLGRRQFCWAGFEFCGLKIGLLATVVLDPGNCQYVCRAHQHP